MKIVKIHIGGWYQRTTLHLTEIWLALKEKKTEVDLDLGKLRKLIDELQVNQVSRENWYLEYILVEAKQLSYRIYEDGLIVLEKEGENTKKDLEDLDSYYNNRLSPFISYLFSKGAPVPKELADIKTILPYIITTEGADWEIKDLLKEMGENAYTQVERGVVGVYRSPSFIVINNVKDPQIIQAIIESQIFFREFKTQLHRYLSIHRIVWERIAGIREKAFVGGDRVTDLHNQLRDYQKTINLISSRIKQMDTYLATRAKIASNLKLDEYLDSLFQYKYETLENTHKYIQHLWEMTENYLNSALQAFDTLADKINKDAFNTLRVVTSIGAIAGIFGYLAREDLPIFTSQGLIYFGILAVSIWLLNEAINQYHRRKNYKMIAEAEKKKTKI